MSEKGLGLFPFQLPRVARHVSLPRPLLPMPVWSRRTRRYRMVFLKQKRVGLLRKPGDRCWPRAADSGQDQSHVAGSIPLPAPPDGRTRMVPVSPRRRRFHFPYCVLSFDRIPAQGREGIEEARREHSRAGRGG